MIFCAWRGERVKKKGSLEQRREKKEVELTWTWFIGLWLRPCPVVVGLNKMGAEPSGCGRCARFLTDREQRKVNKRIQYRWRFQSIGYSLSIIKRFGVWASSMCSPSLFCSSCLWSALSGWVQSHCFFHFCQNCSFFCVKLILLGNIDGEEFDNLTCPLHYASIPIAKCQ